MAALRTEADRLLAEIEDLLTKDLEVIKAIEAEDRTETTDMDELKPLFEKLAKAKFTGSLDLRFEDGQTTSATLSHYLPFEQIGRTLPTIEDKPEESSLKP